MNSDTLVVIPARMASSRFPGKPLTRFANGESLVRRTWRQAREAFSRVYVSTPDEEIIRHCEARGIPTFRDTENHPNGTSRCLKAFKEIDEGNFRRLVNWQVDEPLASPSDVSKGSLIDSGIVTFCGGLYSDWSKNDVCVVMSDDERALFFSRDYIPGAWKHVGIYVFSREVAMTLDPRPTNLALFHDLEQISWLERGIPIHVSEMVRGCHSVNSPGDIGIIDERS